MSDLKKLVEKYKDAKIDSGDCNPEDAIGSSYDDAYSDGSRHAYAKALQEVGALLAAHDAEVRREQMEADCAAICADCRASFWPRGPRKASWSMHERRRNGRVESQRTCDAYVIRRVFAKAEQERNT